ncbi:Clp protease ClpP [Alistipes sp.]|uniref:Clp protease ClpP n=1 Tax=Alistipes sp. TaxID=1872444 RepID=UPI003AF99759
MKSEIQINNSAGVCRIDIEGTIGVPEEWQFDDPEARIATYETFRNTVRRIAQTDSPEVVVEIRSTGGDVNDALLIHDALCSLDAHITTRCYGYTASAATIIAQAASPGCREISANALYLIHTAVCAAEGNAAELACKLDLLRQTDARIAAVYAARSGRPADEFEELMAENNGNGRWLSPEEAVAAGLADTVIDAGERTAPSLVQNIARGWERLLAGIGLGRGRSRELPADRNVLHTGAERQELLYRPATALEQAQQHAAPTATKSREDPSCGDTAPTANQRAYAEDIKRLKSI